MALTKRASFVMANDRIMVEVGLMTALGHNIPFLLGASEILRQAILNQMCGLSAPRFLLSTRK